MGVAYGRNNSFKTKSIPTYPYWALNLFRMQKIWWHGPWFGSFFISEDHEQVAKWGGFCAPQEQGIWMWHEFSLLWTSKQFIHLFILLNMDGIFQETPRTVYLFIHARAMDTGSEDSM